MIPLSELLTGWTSFLPILATLALLLRGGYLISRLSRAHGRTTAHRIKGLRYCRSLVAGLPLLGIMGTVLGLMDTLGSLGNTELQSAQGIGKITEKFAPALASTFWGVVGAIVCLIFLETCIHSLEEESDE